MEEVGTTTRKRGRPSNDNNNNDIIEKKESKSSSKSKGSKSSKVNYNVGDKVMALDKTNGAIYEAKILKVHYVGKQYKYFIHFQKWNPKYDTWTDDTNLAPIDDKEAIAILQASARVIIVADDKKGKKNKVKLIEKTDEAIAAVSTSSSSNPIVNRGIVINETALKKARKQLAESDQIDFDDTPDDPCTITIDIPINLKEHLVDEHGLICNEPKHLILLPRCNNVASIIQDFLAFKESKLVGDPDGFLVYKELFEGLCLLFDKSLPIILLYRHERNQFDIISEKIKEKDDEELIPSLIYGPEHLLRLFSRLPKLLSQLFMPTSEMNQITSKISEFLKWFSQGNKSEHNEKKIKPKYIEIEEYVLADDALNLKEKKELLSSSGRKIRSAKKQVSDDYI